MSEIKKDLVKSDADTPAVKIEVVHPDPLLPATSSDWFHRAVYVVKELGLTTALVGFVCYLLAVQMPSMQKDFRMQTDKLVEAVNNNNRVMTELKNEIQTVRQNRLPGNP